MLTEILNGGNPSVEIVAPLPPKGAGKAVVLLTVKAQDTTLEARFELRITEGEDPWAVRLRALRRGMLLYRSLWATLKGFVDIRGRELPEPLRENLGTWRYLVYRDAGKGVEIRVELQHLEDEGEEEWRYEARCEEYEADCRTLAEAAVHAYEQIAVEPLDLAEAGADE